MAITSRSERLSRMLGVLAANFRMELTDLQREAYDMGLSDVPTDAFAKMGTRALRECKFMPSVAELRELAGVKKNQQAPTPHYYKSADDELERQETCSYHREHGPSAVAPDFIWWCRKCKRGKLAAAPRGETRALGEMLEEAGWSRGKAVND